MAPAVAGLVAGLVGGAVAPALVTKNSVRRAAKSLIKGALFLYERGRVEMATLSESISDLVAEAQEERGREMDAGTEMGTGVVTALKQKPAAAAPDHNG